MSHWECPMDSSNKFNPKLLAVQMLIRQNPERILRIMDKEVLTDRSLEKDYRDLINLARMEIEDMEENLYYSALADEHAAMQYGIEAMQSDRQDAEVAACGFNPY